MEEEPDKVEVIDFFGENFNKKSVPCSIGLLIILAVAISNLFFMVLFPGTYISLYFSLVIIVGFVLYYSYILTKNPGRIRKFTISNIKIEIILPATSLFHIYWNEFEKLEIIKREFNHKPFCKYELHFLNFDTDKVVDLSLFDFQKANIKKILVLLKDYTKKMKKDFAALKETIISGVVLVENFKI